MCLRPGSTQVNDTEQRITAMPRGKPFPKGKSGNPAGRPKIHKEINRIRSLTLARYVELVNKYISMEPKEIEVAMKAPGISVLEIYIAKIIHKGIQGGDTQRLEFLLGRLIGKVPDKIQLSGLDGGPIKYSNLSDEELKDRKAEIIKRLGDSGSKPRKGRAKRTDSD